MMKIIFIYLLGSFFFLSSFAFSKDIPHKSVGDLKFIVDKTIFMETPKKGYCEFYFQTYADQLSPHDHKYTIQVNFEIKDLKQRIDDVLKINKPLME